MFDEPDYLQSSSKYDCFEEEKISSPLVPGHLKDPETPKLQKKRTKSSMIDSDDKSRKGKEAQRKSQYQNFGHWTIEENKRYHWFLEIHSNHFLNKHLRRMDKIFKSMALFVGSRQAEQCRSHHQKMEKKFNHSICQILLYLRRQHYNSERTENLQEQIQKNGIRIECSLLSQEFFQQNRQERSNFGQILSEKQPECQLNLKGFSEEEVKNQDNQKVEIERQYDQQPLQSLIDSLFDVEAPHHNFFLI